MEAFVETHDKAVAVIEAWSQKHDVIVYRAVVTNFVVQVGLVSVNFVLDISNGQVTEAELLGLRPDAIRVFDSGPPITQ